MVTNETPPPLAMLDRRGVSNNGEGQAREIIAQRDKEIGELKKETAALKSKLKEHKGEHKQVQDLTTRLQLMQAQQHQTIELAELRAQEDAQRQTALQEQIYELQRTASALQLEQHTLAAQNQVLQQVARHGAAAIDSSLREAMQTVEGRYQREVASLQDQLKSQERLAVLAHNETAGLKLMNTLQRRMLSVFHRHIPTAEEGQHTGSPSQKKSGSASERSPTKPNKKEKVDGTSNVDQSSAEGTWTAGPSTTGLSIGIEQTHESIMQTVEGIITENNQLRAQLYDEAHQRRQKEELARRHAAATTRSDPGRLETRPEAEESFYSRNVAQSPLREQLVPREAKAKCADRPVSADERFVPLVSLFEGFLSSASKCVRCGHYFDADIGLEAIASAFHRPVPLVKEHLLRLAGAQLAEELLGGSTDTCARSGGAGAAKNILLHLPLEDTLTLLERAPFEDERHCYEAASEYAIASARFVPTIEACERIADTVRFLWLPLSFLEQQLSTLEALLQEYHALVQGAQTYDLGGLDETKQAKHRFELERRAQLAQAFQPRLVQAIRIKAIFASLLASSSSPSTATTNLVATATILKLNSSVKEELCKLRPSYHFLSSEVVHGQQQQGQGQSVFASPFVLSTDLDTASRLQLLHL